MGKTKGVAKFLSICAAVLMGALVGSLPAKAAVDIWNEDGVTYRVVVIESSGQTVRSLDAGNFWKGICERCVVKINPLTGDSWSDQIEASSQDVITIEHGSLRIGEGSRN